MTMINQAALDQLATGFRGEIITPADPRYDAARVVWNGDIDRRPALVLRPVGAVDVAEAISLGRDQGFSIAVRGGGHAVAGYGTVDEGLIIDLSLMRGVRVDVENRRAVVQGGALWGDVDRETQAHGLATTGGIVSHTGVAGLTLGGGLGWLMRKLGLTVDNLAAAQLVTADGQVVRASDDENPELMWGLRGGGGNFGIVTEFEFELHPVGPTIFGGLTGYPIDEAPGVLANLRDYLRSEPTDFAGGGNLRLAPPAPFIPEELHGTPIVAVVCGWAGDPADAQEGLAPLRQFGEPAFDSVIEKPYVVHQKMLDALVPHGRRYYWRSKSIPELSDDLIEVIAEQAAKVTSIWSTIPIFDVGGAVNQVPADATAFGSRDYAHDINMVSAWDADDDGRRDEHVRFVRDFDAALEPFALGTYVNFTSDEDAGAALASSYDTDRLKRLTALKDEFDPDNVFRLNVNIPPSG